MLADAERALEKEDADFRASLDGVLRLYVDEEHLERAVEVVRRLVHALPRNLDLMVETSRSKGASAAAPGVARLALAYVAGKEDLLPESRYGIYGYLDDAYLVSRTLLLLDAALPDEERGKLEPEPEHFVKLERLLVLANRLLPEKVKTALDAKVAEAKALLEKGAALPRGVAILALRAEDAVQAFAAELAKSFPPPPNLPRS